MRIRMMKERDDEGKKETGNGIANEFSALVLERILSHEWAFVF